MNHMIASSKCLSLFLHKTLLELRRKQLCEVVVDGYFLNVYRSALGDGVVDV